MSGEESTGLLVAGDLYMDRLAADGTQQGFLPVSNATQMAINQGVEFKEQISRKRDTRGQLLESVAIPQPGEINLSLDEINRGNLAMVSLGTVENLDEGAATLTDEPVTLKGYNWTEIGYRNLKESGFSVSESGGTSLTVGTDVEVNYRLGLIRALRGGSLTGEGDDITITGETNALTGSRIKGATRPQIRARLLLDGRNMVDDKPLLVTVDEAILRPNEAIDFLSEEFVTAQMTGRMITQPGKVSPYTVDWLDAS